MFTIILIIVFKKPLVTSENTILEALFTGAEMYFADKFDKKRRNERYGVWAWNCSYPRCIIHIVQTCRIMCAAEYSAN